MNTEMVEGGGRKGRREREMEEGNEKEDGTLSVEVEVEVEIVPDKPVYLPPPVPRISWQSPLVPLYEVLG